MSQWKTTSMEEDKLVLITFKLKAKQQLMVVALLRATLFTYLSVSDNLNSVCKKMLANVYSLNCGKMFDTILKKFSD